MDNPRYGLIAFGLVGSVLAAVGLIVLLNSTDFDPNPFLEDQSNRMGQLMGVVVAATGVLTMAISVAAGSICRALQRD